MCRRARGRSRPSHREHAKPARRQHLGVDIRAVVIALTLIILGVVTTLAIPVKLWRTGDQALSPLRYSIHDALTARVRRVWIDTDAACGAGSRTDPDDCLAIMLIARTPGIEIAGISTVFGNAPREVVDRTVAELLAKLSPETGRAMAATIGSSQPIASLARPTAHPALVAALEAGPLVIIALGPLTNIAATLQARPDLVRSVDRLVSVMGRRPGHIFHPAEGSRREGFYPFDLVAAMTLVDPQRIGCADVHVRIGKDEYTGVPAFRPLALLAAALDPVDVQRRREALYCAAPAADFKDAVMRRLHVDASQAARRAAR